MGKLSRNALKSLFASQKPNPNEKLNGKILSFEIARKKQNKKTTVSLMLIITKNRGLPTRRNNKRKNLITETI